MSKGRTKLLGQVSFRVEEEFLERAAAEARKYGVSPHELARQVFLDWLTDHRRHAVEEALAELIREVAKQRADLKESVIAILCDAGKLERREAEEWVTERLFA